MNDAITPLKPITCVLVANRGEIACRILRGIRVRGLRSVAVYSDVDAGVLDESSGRREGASAHIGLADVAVPIGEARAYLDVAAIIAAAQETGADAIHPGYGFLAESSEFVRSCNNAGITFIGPSAEAMQAFGDKRHARALAEKTGVSLIPGAQRCDDVEQARAQSKTLGFPLLLKAAAGGGGRGMRLVHAEHELQAAFDGASREAIGAFGDGRLLLERYIENARHIEVQILAGAGKVLSIGDRECSLQRRYQKVLEEAPASAITENTRTLMHADAIALLSAIEYTGAATVEFLVGGDGQHYFLEVNTRLQVEHPVTELCWGVDLVHLQLHVAAGHAPKIDMEGTPARGHAIEARINAEDPYGGFLPTTGRVLFLEWPVSPFVRVDAGIVQGQWVGSDYDSLLAKIIVWGATREQARRRLAEALHQTIILGVETNIGFLHDVIEKDFFIEGQTFTSSLEEHVAAGEFTRPVLAEGVWSAVHKEVGVVSHQGPIATGAQGDTYSPWQEASLRGFRNV